MARTVATARKNRGISLYAIIGMIKHDDIVYRWESAAEAIGHEGSKEGETFERKPSQEESSSKTLSVSTWHSGIAGDTAVSKVDGSLASQTAVSTTGSRNCTRYAAAW